MRQRTSDRPDAGVRPGNRSVRTKDSTLHDGPDKAWPLLFARITRCGHFRVRHPSVLLISLQTIGSTSPLGEVPSTMRASENLVILETLGRPLACQMQFEKAYSGAF
jgi:hypothetical protein